MSEIRELPVSVQEAFDSTPCRVQDASPDTPRESFALHTGAVIFARLLQMTMPIIEAYHSDLYYDALQLNDILLNWDRKGHLQYRYAFDNCGTWLVSKDNPEAHLFVRDYIVDLTIYAVTDRYGYDSVFLKIGPVDSE